MANTKKNTGAEDTVPLERLIARLEEIVTALESGEQGLEKSIDLYSEGRRLGKEALTRLGQLEERIQIVTRAEEGEELETEPFDSQQD